MSENMDARAWLGAFLRARRTPMPNGRPLYAYRCNDEECAEACALLKSAADRGLGIGAFDVWWGALFCLYASEWWRRNHDGGAWAWYKVLDSLGFDTPALQAIYPVIHRGMQWWRRRVFVGGNGHQYLVTLACEGGLPLHLVRREGNNLRRYFRAVFEEFGLRRDRGADPTELAARAALLLPVSLRRHEVFAIGGALVDAVWALRASLPSQGDPLDALEKQQPGWREALPLRLDDAIARELLRGLVADAVEVVHRPRLALRVETALERAGERWVLRRAVRCPSQVSAEALATLLRLEVGALPSRFSLFVQPRRERPLLLAHCTRRAGSGSEDFFLLEGYGRSGLEIPSSMVSAGFDLAAVAAEGSLATVPLPGGVALGDVPWVFEAAPDDEQRLRLVATASFRSALSELRVVLPISGAFVPRSGATVREDGWVDPGERAVLAVTGEVEITDAEAERYLVGTGATASAHVDVIWDGAPLPIAEGAIPAWRGAPRIFTVDALGMRRAVPTGELQWRPSGTSTWRPWDDTCCGDVDVRWAGAAGVRLRGRQLVLPLGFGVTWPASAAGDDPTMILGGFGDAFVQVANDGFSAERDGDRWFVRGHKDTRDRGKVALEVAWTEGRRARFDLPSPCPGVRFLQGGNLLGEGAGLAVEQIAGVTLEVQAPPTRRPVMLVGRAIAHDLPQREFRVEVSEEATGFYRMNLARVRSEIELRLAMSRDIDAAVALSVEVAGGERLHGVLRVGRLAGALRFDGDEVVLTRDGEADLGAPLTSLRLEARPMWRPTSRDSVELAPAGDGRWHFDRASRTPGPWLVVGWLGAWCCLRPTLTEVAPRDLGVPTLSLPTTPPDDAVPPLERVIRIASTRERVAALDALIAELACDAQHPAWSELEGFVATVGELPATTFDVVDRLVANPQACALALLLWGGTRFEALWNGLERLPFLWDAVSLGAWTSALQRWRSACVDALPEELRGAVAEVLTRQLAALLGQVSIRRPAVGVLLSVAIHRAGFALDDDEHRTVVQLLGQRVVADAVTEDNLRRTVQQLYQLHADDHWPRWPSYEDAVASLPTHLRAYLPDDGGTWRQHFLHAPIVLALAAATDRPIAPAALFDLRALREFDGERWTDIQLWTTIRALSEFGALGG